MILMDAVWDFITPDPPATKFVPISTFGEQDIPVH